MSAVEIALAKQRLQLEAAAQRVALLEHATGLEPAFQALDQAHAGACWLGRHPAVLAGAVAVLAATRDDTRRFVWRWGRRAFVAWRFWRDGRRWLHSQQA